MSKNSLMFRINVSKQAIGYLNHIREAILRFQVIRAIHKKQVIRCCLRKDGGSQKFDAGNKLFRIERQKACIGVTRRIGEMDNQNFCTIGGGPIKLTRGSFSTNTAPEDSVIYS